MSANDDQFSGILDKMQEFCSSGNIEREFENFARDHADVFVGSLQIQSDCVAEHPIEFHAVYTKYLNQFESKFERFIEQVRYYSTSVVITLLALTDHNKNNPEFQLTYVISIRRIAQ